MANRGTKTNPRNEDKPNWTGAEFKKYAKEQLDKISDDEVVSINRGTGKAYVRDLRKKGREYKKPKYVSTGRGTGRVKL
jgi:hypothetical protein